MLISRNAEGVHGQRKVGNPCTRQRARDQDQYLSKPRRGWDIWDSD